MTSTTWDFNFKNSYTLLPGYITSKSLRHNGTKMWHFVHVWQLLEVFQALKLFKLMFQARCTSRCRRWAQKTPLADLPPPVGGRSTTRSGAEEAAPSGAAAVPAACAETPTAASPPDRRRTALVAPDAAALPAAAGCRLGSNKDSLEKLNKWYFCWDRNLGRFVCFSLSFVMWREGFWESTDHQFDWFDM